MRIQPQVMGCLAIASLGCHGGTVPGAPPPAQRPLASSKTAVSAVPPHAERMPFPVLRHTNYVIDFGHYTAEVDPVDGGRIIAFSLDGRNVLATRETSPVAYGSSFWTSPQSEWVWPPPPAMDKDEWKVAIDGTALVLESGTDAKLGLSARQRIAADPTRGALAIEFTLTNHGAGPRRVPPWQNTRVGPHGLTFHPSSQGALSPSTLKLAPVDGVVWFAHVPAAIKESAKFFGDGNEGWIGHVEGDLVFVKVFPDVPRQAQAPREAEIEIYVHQSGLFVEVEQQGPYVEIAAGASYTWTVQWLVRKLPAALAAQPGGGKLVEYVRGLVAGLR